MSGIFSLVVDILLVALMAVTIFNCVRLSRRLNALRESRAEMDATIKQFFEASAKADLAIKSFQRNAGDTAQRLDGEVTKTKLLIDELKIIIEAGNNLAARLEGDVEQSRQHAPSSAPPLPAVPAPEPKSDLRSGTRVASPATAPTSASPDILEPPAADIAGGKRSEGRTKAEQELLKALQNMR